jgi:hypothetical protein
MQESKPKITPKNIKNFIQGYSSYYYDNIFGLPTHIKQQVAYRLYECRDTCLKPGEDGTVGRCQVCQCPTIQKAYAPTSCNPEKFTDMLDKRSWELFMQDNNLTDKIVAIQKEIDEIVGSNK